MNRSSRWAVAAAMFVSTAAMSVTAHARIFDAETFVLDNGLEVVVVTNRSAPVVSHMLWYRVGAADEPPGVSGIAHYLEHLMFLGTDTMPEGEFNDLVARNGGEQNAFTSWDFTAYFQNVAVDRLPLMLALESDRMANLAVTVERALIERDVVLEERRERIDNSPPSRLGEQMLAALYQNHPYGVPIIGWEHEMAALTLDDALAFYETWYAPNNAVLVVAGDIDAETLRPMVEETYGTIPSRPVPERMRPQEPEQFGARRVIVVDPAVRQPDWRRYYLAPTYRTSQDNDVYALQVLNELFGADTTSRLYQALVVDQEIATGAGSAYSPSAFDQAQLAIFVTPRADTAIAAIEAAIDAEVARLLADGVGEEEVAQARERLAVAAAFAGDSLSGPAHTIGRALTVGLALEELQAWPESIRAVTVEDVERVARRVLDTDRSVTGLLIAEAPRPEAPASGQGEE